MKKTYVTPDVEKVAFQYRDQVVVASGETGCLAKYGDHPSETTCKLLYWATPEGK